MAYGRCGSRWRRMARCRRSGCEPLPVELARGEGVPHHASGTRAQPIRRAVYGMRTRAHFLIATAFIAAAPLHAQSRRPIVAIFAHPDDERVIGPLLSRLAREGRETDLVIATDGSKGVRDFAHIPAGAALAAARAKEAACAAN